MNQKKGDKYENYIKLLLENRNNKTWLWKDIPELGQTPLKILFFL
jgi:hypothetical protein